ncbi:MAG: Hsp20/alpha crystallin family protein [Clostridia bacterium]|jgi:HSP20 family molecular chaperone IbpA|nr:Hsp20/alpha crystallin family protein [Clostridia bacterium]MCI2000051.1 Hsp20/alpha crystallin family protein [Clostridia bacterium]MCI2014415.1 Hsp20/alpha crystallin family protein [Clostridia bacterium]
MMMPSIFGKNLFDDFDDFSFPSFGRYNRFFDREAVMRTDVKEENGKYVMEMDVPGFNKNDVSINLENGCLTVEAKKEGNKDEKDDKGNFIRQERFSGSCSRSFYVGENVKPEDIKAKFENGILHIELPKFDEKKQLENKTNISIE